MAVVRKRSGIPPAAIAKYSGHTEADGDRILGVPQYVHRIRVNTANVTGSGSLDNQYKIYFNPGNLGTGTWDIAWGDGTIEESPDNGYIHTYPGVGTYTVGFSGTQYGQNNFIGGGGAFDLNKVIEVTRWGNTTYYSRGWEANGQWNCASPPATMEYTQFESNAMTFSVFGNCTSLNQGIDTFPITSAMSHSLASFFFGVSWVQADWSSWNPVNCNGLSVIGTCATYGIAGWDVSNFSVVAISNVNFNEDISGWTPSSSLTQVSFSGCESFNRNVNWNIAPTTIASCFLNCKVFNEPLDNWDVSGVTNMQGLFGATNGARSTIFTGDLNSWDTSGVVNMREFMRFSGLANPNISDWSTDSLDNLRQAFRSASTFNRDIGTKVINAGLPNEYVAWDVSSVTQAESAFAGAASFNNGGSDSIKYWNISGWDLISFSGCVSFNQPINTLTVPAGTVGNVATYTAWDMTGRTSITGILQNCQAFDKEVTDWDVSSVTNFSNAFSGATVFNNGGVVAAGTGLDTWNVSSALTISGMFADADGFTGELNGWGSKTSGITDMSICFQRTPYNNSLSAWDTSSVNSMYRMFYQCNGFNQPLTSWSIASLQDATEILQQTAYTTADYDALLDINTGWASQATIQSGVSFGIGSVTFTLGGDAELGHTYLTGTKMWNIVDGGGV